MIDQVHTEESRGMFDESNEEILKRRARSLATEAAEEETGELTGVLLFRLDDEWYAVRVGEVREIYQEYTITNIPCVPDYILGVVNIRGEIISVTDIARLMRLGSLTTDLDAAPSIVIQNEECTTAMVVDEIGDIADIPRDGVEPPLSTIDKVQAEFIAGSIYVNNQLIGLVNVNRILAPIGSD
jgi:purine-binding chemotaxis protein CheW